MFKKILVPVDGSRTSRLGLEEAIKLAKDQRAMLYILHVVDEQGVLQGPSVSSGMFIDDFLRTMRENGRTIIADAEAIAKKSGVRAKSLMVENFSGPTADAIVSQAKKLKANLIVLGTHGRRGIKRLVMGSDAEGVIRNTPVPVLLMRTAPVARKTRKRAGKFGKQTSGGRAMPRGSKSIRSAMI